MHKYLTFLLSVLLLSACSPKSITVPATDPEIKYMGRVLPTDSGVTFTYPGVTAMVAFRGTGLSMQARPGSGYFVVEIDKEDPFKIHFNDTTSSIVLATDMENRRHFARIVYAQEGYEVKPLIRSFTIDGPEASIAEARRPRGPRIEFIGNSITCGYGSEATDPHTHFSYDTEDHTLSYAYLTARKLDADFNIVARSGIGIYRSYGGPREGTPEQTMPGEYDRTLLYQPQPLWNHASFHPDIICLNLGTNDTSLDNYDIGLFETHAREFVAKLRRLHPGARIVLLTGSMLHGQALADVRSALDAVAADPEINPGGAYVVRFDMSEQTGALGYGADYHPSALQHRKMSSELTPFLRWLLVESQPDLLRRHLR